ncbi:MOSC domain-containing protein YiiM [Phyllobacterium trifolii]|uniref:MOSC domain-containing protein YiiM n=2 Tax=Phyllobacterium trifolii TaxID=300193 RepID=A0A839UDD1_9HYPH|nr:MOSC domain-containing protein YiiM [Phyllobacterium trifolii]
MADRLVSVNVGQPREIRCPDGRRVKTSIWKTPVPNRVFARRLNIDGDRQADLNGHGGEQRAVLVYQSSSYQFWETLLSRPTMPWGQFGENLSVEGMSDDEVCIGDRYQIGTAIFEVSQPRVTCHKLAIRLDQADMPSLLVRHSRPGFYMGFSDRGADCKPFLPYPWFLPTLWFSSRLT